MVKKVYIARAVSIYFLVDSKGEEGYLLMFYTYNLVQAGGIFLFSLLLLSVLLHRKSVI